MSSTPSRTARLLRPSTLEPVEIDLRLVFGIGMALWAVALVVMVVVQATGTTTGRGIPVCATGIALGALGVLWEQRRRRRSSSSAR